jgi:hypothetical protein
MIFGPFVDYARQPVNRLRPCSSTHSPRPPVLRVPETPGNPSDLLAVTGRAPAGSAAADPHHSELADATLKGIKARPSQARDASRAPPGLPHAQVCLCHRAERNAVPASSSRRAAASSSPSTGP